MRNLLGERVLRSAWTKSRLTGRLPVPTGASYSLVHSPASFFQPPEQRERSGASATSLGWSVNV
jgi:hypothetical protein